MTKKVGSISVMPRKQLQVDIKTPEFPLALQAVVLEESKQAGERLYQRDVVLAGLAKAYPELKEAVEKELGA